MTEEPLELTIDAAINREWGMPESYRPPYILRTMAREYPVLAWLALMPPSFRRWCFEVAGGEGRRWLVEKYELSDTEIEALLRDE